MKKRTVSVCARRPDRADTTGRRPAPRPRPARSACSSARAGRPAGTRTASSYVNGRTLASLTSTGVVGAIGSKTPGPGVGWTYGTTSSKWSPVRIASMPGGGGGADGLAGVLGGPVRDRRHVGVVGDLDGRRPAPARGPRGRPSPPARRRRRPTHPGRGHPGRERLEPSLDGGDGVVHRPVDHAREHAAARGRAAGGDRHLGDAAPVDDGVLAGASAVRPTFPPAQGPGRRPASSVAARPILILMIGTPLRTGTLRRRGVAPARPARRGVRPPRSTAPRRRRSRSRPRERGWLDRSGRAFPLASAPRRPSVPAARTRRALWRRRGRDRFRRGSSACRRSYGRGAYVGNVRTSEVCARAPCASGRRAWRRRARDGLPPCVRRGRAPPRPRGSSGLRRRAPRRAAPRRSALRRACAPRSGRARRAPSPPSRPLRAPRTPRAPPRSPRAPGASAAPAPDDSEREQRPRPPERIADRLVLGDRVLERRHGLLDVALRRFDEPSGPCDLREHPVTADTHGVRLPCVQQRHGLVRPAERDQRLCVVGAPPAKVRLTPAGCIGRRLALGEPGRSRTGVSTPMLDDALDAPPARRGERLPGPRARRRGRPTPGRARGRRDGRRRVASGNT